MLKSKNAEEEELETDPLVADNSKGKVEATDNTKVVKTDEGGDPKQRPGLSAENIIELLDNETAKQRKNKLCMTIKDIRELYQASGILARLKIDPLVQLDNLPAYTVEYPGPAYGLIMVVVKANHSSVASPMANKDQETNIPKIGSIIVGVNGYLIPLVACDIFRVSIITARVFLVLNSLPPSSLFSPMETVVLEFYSWQLHGIQANFSTQTSISLPHVCEKGSA